MMLLELYGPLLATIALLIVAFNLKLRKSVLFKFHPPFLEISIPITNKIASRGVLVFLSLSGLYYYSQVNLSSFFPERYKMEIFYDTPGLKESLSIFSKKELDGIGYKEANSGLSNIYYEALDKKVKSVLNYDSFFSLKQGTVHSKGEVFFKLEKKSGFHNYYVTEAKGELTHILERPNDKSISFTSFFEKLPSSHDYIRPTLSTIITGQFILQPRFKQIIAENYRSSGVLFDHTLVGITKVNLFPVPKIENTVYFFELKDKGLIPVAYAVYNY